MERSDLLRAGASATLRADARAGPDRLEGDGASVNPLRPLRPLSVAQALDLGFELFRVQSRRLVPIATALYLPIQLLDLLLRLGSHDSSEASVLTTSGIPVAALGAMRPYEPFILAAQSVALSVLGICCGFMTAAMMVGRAPSLRQMLVKGLKRLHVSVAIVVLSALVYVVLSCVPLVGILLAGPLTFMASVIAGAENVGPVVAMKRSFKLSRSRLGSAVALFLGGMFLLWLARGLLMLGPWTLAAVLGAPEVVINAFGSAAAVVLIIVQPLTATLAAGAYVMLRTRSEGLDLQERVSAVASPA